MQKAIELAKRIRADLSFNWQELIEDYNLHHEFAPIYNSPEANIDKNRIVCYVIYAYDPESAWLDLKKDRITNKENILNSLGADTAKELYKNIVSNKHESVNISIFSYLEQLKDWRWRSIFDFLDYASRMSRFASMETEEEKEFEKTQKDGQIVKYKEDVDISEVTKINKGKGDLLDQALAARKKADDLMTQIKKDFVSTDGGTQSDFGFEFTDSSKKKDKLSWRQYIQERTARIQQQQSQIPQD